MNQKKTNSCNSYESPLSVSITGLKYTTGKDTTESKPETLKKEGSRTGRDV